MVVFFVYIPGGDSIYVSTFQYSKVEVEVEALARVGRVQPWQTSWSERRVWFVCDNVAFLN